MKVACCRVIGKAGRRFGSRAVSPFCFHERSVSSPRGDAFCRAWRELRPFLQARDLMWTAAVARNQRGALTQAGAGIAASRRKSGRFRAAIRVSARIAAEWLPHAGGAGGYQLLPGEIAMTRLMSRFAAAVLLAGSLSGCSLALGSPTVAELKYNPGRYQDRTVAINGVVTSSWGVPLMPFRLYRVDDGTGEVTVVSQGGRVPSKGARVRVKGRVSDIATV